MALGWESDVVNKLIHIRCGKVNPKLMFSPRPQSLAQPSVVHMLL